MTVRPVTVIGLSLAALMLASPAAWAQDSDPGPISTASRAAPPPAAVSDGEPLQVEGGPDDAGVRVHDGKVHGTVEVGVGTNGYRHAAVSMDAPLKGGGEIAIAVDDTQFDGSTRRHRDRAAPSN
jgi:hypothetical protein